MQTPSIQSKLDIVPHNCIACTKRFYGLARTVKNTGVSLCWNCFDTFLDSLTDPLYDTLKEGTPEVVAAFHLWLTKNTLAKPRVKNQLYTNDECSIKVWQTYYKRHPKGKRLSHNPIPVA